MIERYSVKEIGEIFSDEEKFETWLLVELAIINAREQMGEIPDGTHELIKTQARINVLRIHEIEEETKHDLLAFVGCVQEYLDPHLRKYFHAGGVTSYDTEEPATSMMVRSALMQTMGALDKLCASIMEKAQQYKYLPKIHRTHGQHAEPTTLGMEMLFWLDSLLRQRTNLEIAFKMMGETKISGAVGTYAGGLSPELERKALLYLGLKPALVSAQIILRDRHAFVMSMLGILAGTIENIAINIRLYGQTEIREIQEPFGKKQKGSSVMPHKKNTILTENLCGLTRVMRAYSAPMLESIPTWSARDISHSSVERIVVPDAFHLACFGLNRLKRVIDGMVVHEENIQQNLLLSQRTFFSPMVKELLLENGMDPDDAYYLVQECAFAAVDQKKDFQEILMEDPRIPESIKGEELKEAFDMRHALKYIDDVFILFGM